MISRYGYMPGSPTLHGSNAHNLALFLGDFVLDMELLQKRDEDMLGEEEGNIWERHRESNSSGVSFMPLQISGQNLSRMGLQFEEPDVEMEPLTRRGEHA
jgi:hypothetical protein